MTEAASLLAETLAEEKAAFETLSAIVEKGRNQAANLTKMILITVPPATKHFATY
ncbi:hypothetical protein [Pseudomonas sp. RC10]|uniref:hypothetical protein n=1 Tax=Pseudomonas bambusae TaxID=3139142 RepID=UPI0031398D9F